MIAADSESEGKEVEADVVKVASLFILSGPNVVAKTAARLKYGERRLRT